MARGWIKFVAASLMCSASIACAQPCAPTFGTTFHSGELNGPVNAITIGDVGGGPAAYLGGEFTYAGGVAARRVVKWDGTDWTALGEGFDAPVLALAVFDAGSGPRLFAGGTFTSSGATAVSHIAMWSGTAWVPVNAGLNGPVNALLGFNDGSGAALYVGGQFPAPKGVTASNLVRWRASGWSSIGGANGAVTSLVAHDEGSGPALYVGGGFTSIGGTPANRVARWNGATWAALGSGTDNRVHTLASYNDGTGLALYAGGRFGNAGGVPAIGIARWDGQAWSEVTNSLGHGANNHVDALAVYDNGDGPALYAGGKFTAFGLVNALGLARWDGTWFGLLQGPPSFVSPVRALATGVLPGHQPLLLVGNEGEERWYSRFGLVIEGPLFGRLAAPSTGFGGFGSQVTALTMFDDGNGPKLYAGARDGNSAGVFRWEGSEWSRLGDLSGSVITGLAVHDDGEGPRLFACGSFTGGSGSGEYSYLARWDGPEWTAVGGFASYRPECMISFDEGGAGPARPSLFVAGQFSTAGTAEALGIARWDGASWGDVGGGITIAATGASGWVTELAIHDEGSGPALYAAGRFDRAGSVACRNIARWDGLSWSALGAGVITSGANVLAIQSFAFNGEPALYACGSLKDSGGQWSGVRRWRGQQWESATAGLGGWSLSIKAMTVFDDGSGTALYAASGTNGPIFKLSSGQWAPAFGSVPFSNTSNDDGVRVLSPATLGGTPVLIGAGVFSSINHTLYVDNVVELRGCPACYANCDGSTVAPVLNVADFICFMNRFAAADAWANCDASTIPPVLNVADFVCFNNRFAAGCP